MSRDVYAEIARRILRGQSTPGAAEMYEIALGLKRERNFTLARRILNRAMLELASAAEIEQRLSVQIRQQAAVCTYKDTDLPADTRLDRALDILSACEEVSQSTNQETLGIAGAIYKRKWEIDGQRQHLERSIFYYLRGYAQGAHEAERERLLDYLREPAAHVSTVDDRGYTGINAAYAFDQLAHLEEKEAGAVHFGAAPLNERREHARRIREEVIRTLVEMESRLRAEADAERAAKGLEPFAAEEPVLDWWFHATLGEAYFGVGDYVKAEEWFVKRPAALEVPDWEFESTARQLAALAHLQAPPGTPIPKEAEQVLKRLLRDDEHALESTFKGKFGVGLSGGGFRASLYHIGVLARLAELDVLRHVEVFSCVSGGSIVGAHYYLEVRRLLEAKRDREIGKEDYVEIVRRLQRDFLRGVQKNIRTRIAAQLFSNLKMIFSKRYSRTMRAGDLYERHLFSLVEDGGGRAPRYMDDLLITPKEYRESGRTFSPQSDNWRRAAKVPVLILNAATLNTGHTWHFTATYMGEPPPGGDVEIDGNENYRRMYYREAPEGFRRVRLGHAVAASACVQGVFEPLSFEGLYPERTVRLVDGGTCDNQGVGGLLEQDCNVVLISDGSGQMGTQAHPSAGLLGVPLRSVDIVQARVREAQYRELSARRRSGLLRGLMFVHLKADLDVDPVDWTDCQDPFAASDDARPLHRRGPLTSYGIDKDVQRRLAAVRTDLDSFSDVEAYALMTSGYRMTEQAFRRGCVRGFAAPDETGPWEFLQVERGMRVPNREYRHVERLLAVSPSKAFKVWMLSRVLQTVAVALALAFAAGVVYSFFRWSDLPIVKVMTLGSLGISIVLFLLNKVATMLLGKSGDWVMNWRSKLNRAALGLALAVVGTVVAGLHVLFFDRLFLRMGSIVKFNELARADASAASTRPQEQPAGE